MFIISLTAIPADLRHYHYTVTVKGRPLWMACFFFLMDARMKIEETTI